VDEASRSANDRRRAEGLVPGFFVQSVVAALQAERADVPLLARAIGRDLLLADAALLALPSSAYLSLLRNASAALRNPGLGLALGQRLTESSLHMLGPIIVASPTLRSAFESIDVLQVSMLSGEGWRLSEHGDEALYGPAQRDDGGERDADGLRIATDLVLALGFSCARRFVGPKHQDEVRSYFRFAAPEHVAAYQDAFEQRVSFGAARTAIGLPRVLLDAARAGTDAAFANTLQKLALARFAGTDSEPSWTRRLELTLRAHSDLAQVDLGRIAASYQISPRTLRRKVELEGSRLVDVLNRVRFERARALLRLHKAPIREIAESLGYREVSSFQRAFKRWAGVGPGEYRARALSDGVDVSA
jgi:AraC-like DNA-binding protein